MNGFLLDTDTCIEILRGNKNVVRRRRGAYVDVATSEITASELYYGAAKSKNPMHNKTQVDALLKTVQVLPIGRHGAQFFGIFKAQLQAKGQLIPDADLWIGSIARAQNLILVTGNSKHLSRIPKLVIGKLSNHLARPQSGLSLHF